MNFNALIKFQKVAQDFGCKDDHFQYFKLTNFWQLELAGEVDEKQLKCAPSLALVSLVALPGAWWLDRTVMNTRHLRIFLLYQVSDHCVANFHLQLSRCIWP